MTAEECFALPDDGLERWLIRGELRPSLPVSSIRCIAHALALSNISHRLSTWNQARPEPRGEVVGGYAGFRLRRAPDTLVGVDVGYASAELAGATEGSSFFDGPPILAVEILSPTDTHGELVEKIGEYLDAGTVVWEVDAELRRITVHRPGEASATYHEGQELIGDPSLPRFRAAVEALLGG